MGSVVTVVGVLEFSGWDVAAGDLQAVAATLNARPRKTLRWKTPAETLDDQLASLQADGVASTG